MCACVCGIYVCVSSVCECMSHVYEYTVCEGAPFGSTNVSIQSHTHAHGIRSQGNECVIFKVKVGQNCLVISLCQKYCIFTVYMVLANPMNVPQHAEQERGGHRALTFLQFM